MIPRAALLAFCLSWIAVESNFNPGYFLSTAEAGLADLQASLDTFMASEHDTANTWQTALVEQ